ncbi:MAG: response regulator, partial [Alphaproteobacteria bacterium]
ILLVDDNEINVEIAQAILSSEGASVQTAADGVAAVAAVAASTTQPFDAVLMDVHMPLMDGYEATRRIRADPANAALPIIAMTASAMDHERQQCLTAGMNDHIAKPIDVDQAMATLCKWMEGTSDKPSPPSSGGRGLGEGGAEAPPLPLEGEREWIAGSALEGFDIPAALQRVAGNQDLLRRLLLAFAEKNATAPVRLRAMLDAGDVDAAFGLVHAIKGSAGNLGATNLFKVAEAFQTALTTREQGSFEAHFQAFQRQMDEVQATLARLNPTFEPNVASVARTIDDADKRQLVQDCLDLVKLMKKRSLRSVDLADDIRRRLQGSGFDREIQVLEASMTVLDFKTGVTAVQTLIEKMSADPVLSGDVLGN